MKIHPAIVKLLHAYWQTSPEVNFIKADYIIKGSDIIHAQRIMSNDFLIIPCHNLEHPSWYY
jgi:hypothetical protein